MADGMIFNQTNMDNAVGSINAALQTTALTITNKSASFVTYISSNWMCQYAKDFAGQYSTEMQSIISKFRNNANIASNILNDARKNYQEATGNTLYVNSFKYDDPTVDVSPIDTQFSNGDVGIREGFSANDAIKALEDLISAIDTSMETLRTTITNSNALSDSEMTAYGNLMKKVGDITGTEFDGLKQAVNTLVTQTIQAFGTVRNTNVSSITGA